MTLNPDTNTTNAPEANMTTTSTPVKKSKIKVHTLLFDLINANPGITRTTVLDDSGLRNACLTPAGLAGVTSGDELETKRWGRKINRFIRQIRRDDHNVIINRADKVVTYTIAGVDAIAVDTIIEVAVDDTTPIVSTKPARIEEEVQMVSFETLMADLDEEAVPTVSAELKSKNLLF